MMTPEQIQKDYYTRTAVKYDEQHVHHEDEHYTALKYISLLLGPLRIGNILDVGAGTGRAVKYFMEKHPQITVKGIEPVEALLEQAIQARMPRQAMDVRRCEAMPYSDGPFHAV